MKFNRWTLALVATGVVSLGSVAFAEEAQHQVMTALQSTTLSGYVDTSAIWKLGTGDTVVGRAYDGTAKQDGFNLNVVKLTLEKPLDEGQWSAGYKVDLLFGPDANTYGTTSTGAATSDFAIQQAYVNLRAPVGNGLDFQMGVFSTCIGYEVFDSYANPNYSRSYAYTIEPLSHTGVLASYRFTDWLKVSAGIADTWNQPINGRAFRAGVGPAAESEKTYMGLFELTAPESLGFLKDAKLYAGIIDGLNSAVAATASDITSYYVGTTIPTPLEGLSVGASYDYRGTKQNGPFGNSATYANATALYLKYQANEKLSFANRAEYASGSNGSWYFSPEGTDRNNELLGETFTVDYRPWGPNVITRAEFRWDHYLSGAATPGVPYPYGGGPRDGDKNALSLALNVIYKF